MVAQGFQSLLASLLVDPMLRRTLAAAPELLAQEFRLSRAEAASLHGLDVSRLEVAARVVGNKRVRLLQRHLPATWKLLSSTEQLDPILRGYLSTRPPEQEGPGFNRALIECQHFSRFITQYEARGAPYVHDLLRYEQLLVEVTVGAFRSSPHRDASVADAHNAPLGAKPRLCHRSRVARFHCDVLSLARAVHATGEAPSGRPREHSLALVGYVQVPPSVYRIAPDLFRILEHCDGGWTVPEIAEQLSMPTTKHAQIREQLERCRTLEILC